MSIHEFFLFFSTNEKKHDISVKELALKIFIIN